MGRLRYGCLQTCLSFVADDKQNDLLFKDISSLNVCESSAHIYLLPFPFNIQKHPPNSKRSNVYWQLTYRNQPS